MSFHYNFKWLPKNLNIDKSNILNLEERRFRNLRFNLIKFLVSKDILQINSTTLNVNPNIDTRKFSWDLENLTASIYRGHNTNISADQNLDTVFYDVIREFNNELISVKSSGGGGFKFNLSTKSQLKVQSTIGAILEKTYGQTINQVKIKEWTTSQSFIDKISSKQISFEDGFNANFGNTITLINKSFYSICAISFEKINDTFLIHLEKTKPYSHTELLDIILEWVSKIGHSSKYKKEGCLYLTNDIWKYFEKDMRKITLSINLSTRFEFISSLVTIQQNLNLMKDTIKNQKTLNKVLKEFNRCKPVISGCI